MSSSSSISLIPFDGKDFALWKIKAVAYIGGRGWTDAIMDPKYVSKMEADEKQQHSQNKSKVYAFLVNSLSYNILSLFASSATGEPYVMWDALLKHYERDTMASKHATRALMMGQRLGEGEDISVYVSRITSCAQKLVSMGDIVGDGDKLFCLFNGLSQEYNSLKSVLQLKDHITFADAVQHLKDQYEISSVNNINQDGGSSALYVNHKRGFKRETGKSNKPYCDIHKFHGHATKDCLKGKNKPSGHSKSNHGNNGNKGNIVNNSGKPYCNLHKTHGHATKDCFIPSATCHTCGEKGHIKSMCKKGGKGNDDEKGSLAVHTSHSNSNDYSAHAHDVDSMYDYDAFVNSACAIYCNDVIDVVQHAHDACSTKCEDVIKHSEYILDSGATSHYINDLNVLDDVVNMAAPKSVMVANSEKVSISMMGTLTLVGDYGNTITLKEARYVPTFTTNLVSVSKLTNGGATVTFGKDEAKLVKDGKTLLTAKRAGELYYVDVRRGDSANKVSDDLSLYHQRSGHLSLSSIKDILDKNAVLGIEHLKSAIGTGKVSNHMCDGCAMGKSHRTAFKSYSLKPVSDDVCNRIYCDLSGPVNIKHLDGLMLTIFKSLGSPLYLSAIVDEKSRNLHGKLLKAKSDAPAHIMNWIKFAENLHQKKVKYFHSDGGGEYVNKTLSDYFISKGIKVETTCANTPQHNGVVERANRIVFEMARSMMMHAHLPVVFWGEAALTACYLMNHRLCVNDKSKTALEVWSGHKPYVQHLRVFGCDVYVHIHKHNRTKMDAKAIKGIFIGYDPIKENGYRVYDITNHRVIVSRDVQFFEQSFTAGRDLVGGSGDNLSLTSGNGTMLNFDSLSFGSVPNSIPTANSDIDLENKYNHNDSNNDDDTKTPVSDVPVSSLSSIANPSPTTSITSAIIPTSTSTISSSTTLAIPTSSLSSLPAPKQQRKSSRLNMPRAYAAVDDDDMPQTYDEAVGSDEAKHWKGAINEEIESLTENNTFRYVKRSSLASDVNIMNYRWLFRVKLNSSGHVERYKARLVAKGFTQKEGIDYNETFAPVVKYKSLRIILCLANIFNYELKQMDVITAFLNAKLDEDVYMHVPEGFKYSTGDVLKLIKSLYGTKQAPHMWNDNLNAFIMSIGFDRLTSDTCVYVKRTKSGNMIIISIFVDDIVSAYASADEKEWLVVKNLFMSKYKMKDLGDVSWILGMKLSRDRVRGVLSLDQSLYLNKVLSRFNMMDSNPVPTPESSLKLSKADCPISTEEKYNMRDVPYMSAVGSLLYAAIGTRPDIAHAVNVISKFMENPGQAHWLAVKRILRYIKGTVNKALVFTSKGITGNQLYVSAYSDADWAGDIEDRKSTTGFVVRIGDSSVIWCTKKQKTVSLSSAEAEYMALAAVVQEVKWVNQFLCELLMPYVKLSLCISVYVDNQAAIMISKNDVYHDRTKHIDIRYHFIRDAIKDGLFKIEWVSTEQQLADGFTKALSTITFNKLFHSVMNKQ